MKKPIVIEPLLALCALIVLVCMTVASFAQQTQPERPRQACAADYQKFCSDTEAGKGRVAQCMRQHESELSDTCKVSLAAAKQQRAARKSTTRQPAQ